MTGEPTLTSNALPDERRRSSFDAPYRGSGEPPSGGPCRAPQTALDDHDMTDA